MLIWPLKRRAKDHGPWRLADSPAFSIALPNALFRLARDSAIDRETHGLTRRTAGCGPACPVVWEGRSCEASPYPDQNASRVSSEWIEASSQYAWRSTAATVQLCSAM